MTAATVTAATTGTAAAAAAAAAVTTAKPLLRLYVLHSPKLLSVRESMCRALEHRLADRFDVRATYITQHEPDDISHEQLKEHFDLTPPTDAPDPVFSTLVRSLHIRHVSNLLKHLAALRAVASFCGDDTEGTAHQLVIEDDAVYNQDVADRLVDTLGLVTDAAASMVMLGLPVLVSADEGKSSSTHELRLEDVSNTFRVLPVCESYLVTPNTAKAIADAFLPCRFANNVQLTYAAAKAGAKIHAVVPNVFVDGSKVGVYISSLTANNRLFMNDDYNSLLAIVRRESFSDADMAEALKIYDQSRFKSHPDMSLLIAAMESKAGRHAKAIQLMSKLFDVYRNNGALLGADSDFLRSYIAMHRFVADQPDMPSVRHAAKLETVSEEES